MTIKLIYYTIFFFAALGVYAGSQSALGMGPENVLVVVNSRSADSLAVANRYIELRNIPPTNVVYLDKITIMSTADPQTISPDNFIREILEPIHDAIKQRGLTSQIHCVTYSVGFPTRIKFLKELQSHLAATGIKYSKPRHLSFASLTSGTFFGLKTFKEMTLLDTDSNWYAIDHSGRTPLANPFEKGSAKVYDAGVKALKRADNLSATKIFQDLTIKNPDQPAVRYQLVRCLALAKKQDEAVENLELCVEQGWHWRLFTEKDDALNSLRSHPRFQSAIKKIGETKIDWQHGRAFSSQVAWARNGWINSDESEGRKYILSTMLALVGPEQSTLIQALDQLERSASADDRHPKGTFFFAKHSDMRSRVRHYQFPSVVKDLKSKGFKVDVSLKKWPANLPVLGATLGSPNVDWPNRECFVKGGLCDNLTSGGGAWPKRTPRNKHLRGQTQLTAHLNAGAAGGSGTVAEPYAMPVKFPASRIHSLYTDGFNLVESFYQTMRSPFQLLIVGDPLCCPYGKFPQFEIDGPVPFADATDGFELSAQVKPNSPPIEHFELYCDGVLYSREQTFKTGSLSTANLVDGYHNLVVVAVSKSPAKNSTRKQIDFTVNRKDLSVEIKARSRRVKLGRPLTLSVKHSADSSVEIWQNTRLVAKLENGSKCSIDSTLLGLGSTKLVATMTTKKGDSTSSIPIEIEIF